MFVCTDCLNARPKPSTLHCPLKFHIANYAFFLKKKIENRKIKRKEKPLVPWYECLHKFEKNKLFVTTSKTANRNWKSFYEQRFVVVVVSSDFDFRSMLRWWYWSDSYIAWFSRIDRRRIDFDFRRSRRKIDWFNNEKVFFLSLSLCWITFHLFFRLI